MSKLIAASLVAVAMTAMVSTASAASSTVLAHWNFNNNTNSDAGDGLFVGPDYYHTAIPNGFYDDGLYTGPVDGFLGTGIRGDLLLPVYDDFGDNPGAAIVNPAAIQRPTPTNLADAAVLVEDPNYVGGTADPSAAIDVSALAGSNDGSHNVTGNSWGSFSGTDAAFPANMPDGQPFFGGSLAIVGQANNNKGFTIELDGAGWQDFAIEYATRGTSSGFDGHLWEWSTDGVNFSTAGVSNPFGFGPGVLPAVKTSTWEVRSIDFNGANAQLAGAEDVFLRVTLIGATSDFGNNRFDNLVVSANVIPEPASLGLLGLGAVALLRRRAARA